MITKKKMIMAIAAIIIAISGYYFFVQAETKQVEKDPLFAEMGQQDKELTKEEVVKSEPVIIKVDVKGAVRTPGVFIAKPGDRVIDLIAAAGDFTKDADADKVNLAQLVEDQMVIYVPRAGEEAVELADAASASTGGTIATTSTTGSSSGNQVNLNTATQAELETLPGIGPSKAIAIIEYRETTGKFQQIEDLKNISGIGDKTFEKLQDSITVQ